MVSIGTMISAWLQRLQFHGTSKVWFGDVGGRNAPVESRRHVRTCASLTLAASTIKQCHHKFIKISHWGFFQFGFQYPDVDVPKFELSKSKLWLVGFSRESDVPTSLVMGFSRRSLWENADKVDRLPPPAQCENPKYLAPRYAVDRRKWLQKASKNDLHRPSCPENARTKGRIPWLKKEVDS